MGSGFGSVDLEGDPNPSSLGPKAPGPGPSLGQAYFASFVSDTSDANHLFNEALNDLERHLGPSSDDEKEQRDKEEGDREGCVSVGEELSLLSGNNSHRDVVNTNESSSSSVGKKGLDA